MEALYPIHSLSKRDDLTSKMREDHPEIDTLSTHKAGWYHPLAKSVLTTPPFWVDLVKAHTADTIKRYS